MKMNWKRVLLGGVVAGLVIFLSDFVMHGLIMGSTYMRYPAVFSQTPVSPAWFALVALCLGLASALLFSRTRTSWAPGVKGGLTFGFFLGVVAFFPGFYNPLVIDGFPYHLAWCWGGITMIDSLLAGATLGAVIKA